MYLFIDLIVENEDSNVAFPKILDVFKDSGKTAEWRAEHVEACGWPPICEKLHAFSDNNEYINGEEFYSIITPKIQIIEGTFYVHHSNEGEVWLTVNVKDGSCIDIITEVEDIVLTLQRIYPHSELFH